MKSLAGAALLTSMFLAGCGQPETAVRYHWKLRYAGAARPQTLSCGEVDGRKVLFELRDPKTVDNHDTRFDCEAHEAIVPAPTRASSPSSSS